jgi:hypothetical protein
LYFIIDKKRRETNLAKAAGAWGSTGINNPVPGKTNLFPPQASGTALSLQGRLSLVSKAMADTAVCSSTAEAYSTHWNVWKTYVTQAVQENGMVVSPEDFTMGGWPYETRVAFITNFYAFCLSERAMAASTIHSCSSAIKKVFLEGGLSIEAFEDPRCKTVRAGAERWDTLYREKKGQKLPVSGDMVRQMVSTLTTQGGKKGWMQATAALLGFYSALRVCEYVCTNLSVAESHLITAADMAFLCGDTNSQWIASWALSVNNRAEIQRMQVTLRSAKNDQRAKGASWVFYKGQDEHGIIFIDLMADWACTAHSMPTDPFISYRDPLTHNLCSLKYHGYNSAIKKAARACGFDPADFSTHSLRIGALSQLTAAGVSMDAVQRVARHKSAHSTFHYQTTSVKEREAVVTALASDQSFGMKDVQALQVRGKGKNQGSSGRSGSW